MNTGITDSDPAAPHGADPQSALRLALAVGALKRESAVSALKRESAVGALKRACGVAGGQKALARRIGTTQSRVWYWLVKSRHGAAAPFVIAIEAATGVPRHELRPDIYPAPAQPAAGPDADISAQNSEAGHGMER